MGRAARAISCAFLLAAALSYRAAHGDALRAEILGRGSSKETQAIEALPTPPRQAVAWAAPKTKLPEDLLTATAALFQQGLADPRGCEYRSIKVFPSGRRCGGDDATVSTHGWVVPTSAGAGPRFAVCWNGSIYPVVTIGEPADLRATVLAAIEADEKKQSGYGLGGQPRDDDVFDAASLESPNLLWSCLLLRLGRADLAEQVWAHYGAGEPSPRDPGSDPYIDLAENWTWPLYCRALRAHMNGDDPLALQTAKMLAPIWEDVQAVADKRGCPLPEPQQGQRQHPAYLEDIAPIRDLLADQLRRADERREGKSPPVLASLDDDSEATLAALKKALGQCPDAAHRIALLVQELEEVSARESEGSFDLANDPVVQLLIEEGEPAVGPLLACLENDSRLTRSVSLQFAQSTHGYSAVAVSEAAYIAITHILQTDFFGNALTWDDLLHRGKAGRLAVARRIRIYFNKYKGLPREERWYRILLDDRAPMARWVEAARNIVEPCDPALPGANAWAEGQWVRKVHKLVTAVKLPGEALRGKNDPSVSQILEQRIGELPAEMACDVAISLANWDPKAALPIMLRLVDELPPPQAREVGRALIELDPKAALPQLRKLTHAALAEARDPKKQLYPGESREWGPFLDLIRERLAIDDPWAAKEYAAWIRACSREETDSYGMGIFAPLAMKPRDPLLSATAEWVFNDAKSPWNPILGKPTDIGYLARCGYALDLSLIELPAYRKQLARLLTDRAVMGRRTIDAGAFRNELLIDKKWVSWGGGSSGAVDFPPPHATAEFRVCDWMANGLSAIHGMPKCELNWPQAKRDVAVVACAERLAQYGERIQYKDGYPAILLPVLDHPATPQDVRAGRAIFSLAGQGKTRVVRLPTMLAAGRWRTLNDYPFTATYYNPATNENKSVIDCDREGTISQVEEVEIGGAWHRYYGFVGRYCVAKVPAEEIDFSFGGDETKCVDGIEVLALSPGEDVPADAALPWIGGPLVTKVIARNVTGLDRRLPRFVFSEQGVAPPTGSVALTVELSFAARRPHETVEQQTQQLSTVGTEPLRWRLVPRKTAPFRARSVVRTLKPLEEVDIIDIDLRDHFQLPGAGWYRLVVKWPGSPKEGLWGGEQFLIERKAVKGPK